MTQLILSRHGNTFGPNDPVVWTGSKNDLPLVKKGFEQAERFAQALITQKIRPSAIYCGPLQRTSAYADILVKKLHLPFRPTLDSRLNEIDYGDWTGLTQAEVRERFGEASLREWEERSQWPEEGNWTGSPSTVIQEIQSFVDHLMQHHGPEETVIAVTSNGKLRYFLALAQGELEKRIKDRSFKVKTGHICKLVFSKESDRQNRIQDSKIQVPYWNVDPQAVQAL